MASSVDRAMLARRSFFNEFGITPGISKDPATGEGYVLVVRATSMPKGVDRPSSIDGVQVLYREISR